MDYKSRIFKNAIFYKKGTVRKRSNDTSFKMKTDTYEIRNDFLTNIKELL